MLRPGPLLHHAILLIDIVAAFVFVGVGYLVVRNLGASPLAGTASWAVVILANSFEGSYFLWRSWKAGAAAESFKVVNVDAITRWYWNLPGVDGFQRLMWWTPQHEMAITMGLLVLLVSADRAGPQRSRRAACWTVSCSGGRSPSAASTASSSSCGTPCSRSGCWPSIAARTSAAGSSPVPWPPAIVLGCLGLTVALQMIQSTSGASIWGWNRYFLRGPWRFVLLNFGPALVVAPLGLALAVRRTPRLAVSLGALVFVAAAAFLVFDVRGHENTYVVFRAAQLFFLALAVLLALALEASRAWHRAARGSLVVLLVLGSVAAVPTVAMDWYNARDTSNVQMNPGGFPWTVHFTPGQKVAARWIQRNLAVDAIVQTDARARGRATWALVPAFCRRRMATGLGLFEPDPTRFDQNMDIIHELYSQADATAAHATCERLGIDYLYVGPVERQANPAGIEKFEQRPDLFRRVYRLMDEEILEVIREHRLR